MVLSSGVYRQSGLGTNICLFVLAALSRLQTPDTLLTCANAPIGAWHQSPSSSLFPSPFQRPGLHDLPTFDQVCQLKHPTLWYIPAKARPAFARALSSSLRDVLQKNTEDAWLKHFMLSKCVPPSLMQKGNHKPHMPIESLCNMWFSNDLTTLWMMAKKSGKQAQYHREGHNLQSGN